MAYRFGHLALFVSNLRAAEAFYLQAFGMEVLFREAVADDGNWYTLRPGQSWGDAEQAGAEIGMVALQRDELNLPIFRGEPRSGTVLEIGITVPADEIDAISADRPESATRLPHEHGDLFFKDPYGYTWHITNAAQPFESNGARDGQWLDL